MKTEAMITDSWKGAVFDARLDRVVLLVYDRCQGGHLSVTNDAEAVVKKCLQRFPTVKSRLLPIIYRDTDGMWDQLLHDGEKFTGFVPIREVNEVQAVHKVLYPVKS